jgi:hypothetical protein
LAKSLCPFKVGSDILVRPLGLSKPPVKVRVKSIEPGVTLSATYEHPYTLVVEHLTKAGEVARNRNPERIWPAWIVTPDEDAR